MDKPQSKPFNHDLPDRIILPCPEQLIPGQLFSNEVIWMSTLDAMETVTATYNVESELIGVTHNTLRAMTRPN